MKQEYKKNILYNWKGNFGAKAGGSITVEASFLFPILFIVIIMLVFLALFYYNKITVWKNTYYVAIKLVEAKREGTIYDLETEWERISKDTLILAENVKVSSKKTMDCITVIGNIEFNIPFWGKTDVQEKSVVPLCSRKEIIARNKLWKEEVGGAEE